MTVECDPHAAGIFALQTNQPDDKNTGYFLRCELMVGGGGKCVEMQLRC